MGVDVTDEKFLKIAKPVVHVARSNYLDEFPNLSHLSEDLEAAGMLAAVEVLRKRDLSKIDNLEAYLYRAATHAMSEAVAKEDPIANQTKVEGLNREYVAIERQAPDELAVVDLLEEIYACCEDEIDRTIIHWRSLSHTDEEIAEELGLGLSWVNERRTNIEERFNARSRRSL
jgi:DNA-directed RNA polymerase specialized sigma24 family protein